MTEAQTSISWPTLQRESQSPQVKTLQYMLRSVRDMWQQVVVADGIFGPKTEETVRGYQSLVGLTVDGIVGPLTWSSLTGDHGTGVRHGATGERVKAAQNELNRHNYALMVDGIFGDKTDAAVRQFQQKAGLAVDGIVGPDTWRELITRKPA
jgi:peptidoglycan hydrolase-like protein with peptidoglycan-binding domain